MLKLFFERLVFPSAAIASLISITALFGEYHFVFDLVSHFRLQYIAGLIPILFLSLYFKRFLLALLFAVALGIHSYEVFSTQIPLPQHSNATKGHALRLMSVNLQVLNSQRNLLINAIQEINPDVLVLQEMTSAWRDYLSIELADFQYYVARSQLDPFGVGVYSKVEFVSTDVIPFGREGNPSIVVKIISNAKELTIIGTHSLPPITPDLYKLRNAYFREMAAYIAQPSEPIVLVGDLNTTPWSAHFKHLLDKTGLKDSRRGFGIHPTWPTHFLPAMIPIDHVLVSESITILNRQVFDNTGSDHRSVWVDIAL
jgi:endonuclease/exonuclease/phosphatase (EEP) superfamily protein YafD